jgi:uncharacterized membrane protein YgdD (TMEM256/DUF423 family)
VSLVGRGLRSAALEVDMRGLALAGCLLGLTGVGLGAFGAHVLAERLGEDGVTTWELAVRYQQVHAVAALVAVALAGGAAGKLLARAGWAFVIGVVLFSGSLYGLALDGPRWLGPITPLGGVAMLVGWVLLALGSWRAKRPAAG